MPDLFQGSLLPSTTTTTETQTSAPEFYTNYLQDIANLGQNAVNQGGVAGFGPLQQQAFQMAPTTAFAGSGAASDAATLLRASGSTAAPDIINAYMNPYTSNVVNEMARLQQQNLQRNVLPSIGASGVGSGGFGSKRQSQALGQTLADMQANLTGQQFGALNTGYQNAMTAAQSDLTRMMNAGTGLTNAASTQYNIGTGGLKTLSDLGALQQAQGQKMLDYPMTQAKAFADLLHGYTIPTGTVTQTTAPGQQGQFSNSPLSQIAGLLAGLGSFMNATGGTGGSSTPAAGSNPFNLDQATINTLKALNNPTITSFLGLKDGGSVKGYADGGTVDTIADPLTDTTTIDQLPTDVTVNPIVMEGGTTTPTDAVDVNQVVNDILGPTTTSTPDVTVNNTFTPQSYYQRGGVKPAMFAHNRPIPAPVVDIHPRKHNKLPQHVNEKLNRMNNPRGNLVPTRGGGLAPKSIAIRT